MAVAPLRSLMRFLFSPKRKTGRRAGSGRLGTGDAAATMGALEFHATHVGEKLGALAGAVEALGERLGEAVDSIPS